VVWESLLLLQLRLSNHSWTVSKEREDALKPCHTNLHVVMYTLLEVVCVPWCFVEGLLPLLLNAKRCSFAFHWRRTLARQYVWLLHSFGCANIKDCVGLPPILGARVHITLCAQITLCVHITLCDHIALCDHITLCDHIILYDHITLCDHIT
jgi:hypothetical protein